MGSCIEFFASNQQNSRSRYYTLKEVKNRIPTRIRCVDVANSRNSFNEQF